MADNIKTLFFISVAFAFIILTMVACFDQNGMLAPPKTNPIEEVYKSEDPIPSNGKEPQIFRDRRQNPVKNLSNSKTFEICSEIQCF